MYAYGLMTSKLPVGLPGDSLPIVYYTGGLGYTSLILHVPEQKHSIIQNFPHSANPYDSLADAYHRSGIKP